MIRTNRIGQMEYLTAEGIGASHCFTTRLGGVSTGYLASMNIGTSRGDDPANVLENYRRLGEVLGFDPHNVVHSKQTHSDIVRVVTERDRGAGLFGPSPEPCDALVTNVPGLTLVVFTADCTPILFYDRRTGAVGAAHAGWRGTVAAIARRVVETMAENYGTRPEDLSCAIGPNIGQCHFETDADVPDALRSAFGSEMEAFIRPKGAKYFVDLKAVNAWVLRQAGVQDIEISDVCTVCSCDRFWSHRVVGTQRGSQGAVIVCGEVRE